MSIGLFPYATVYKIIAKVISRIIKSLLSKSISNEQFGFLEGRQIHEAIGVAQGLYSIKTRNLKSMVLKVDLSKAYDKVNWLYIRLILLHWALVFLLLTGL